MNECSCFDYNANAYDCAYTNLIRDILDNGIDRPDRTGVGSRALFGKSFTVDLADGFPILTTRKVAFRIAFEETMFFLRGETDTKKLEEKKINIWKGNTTREFLDKMGLNHLPEGNIGTGYSHQWRNFGGFARIPPKLETPFNKEIILTYSSNKHNLIGNVYNSNYGFFTVIQEIFGLGKNVKFKIKFQESGYETLIRKQHLTKMEVYDPYHPSVYGIACTGDISLKEKNPILWKKLRPTWEGIISRCYNENDSNYCRYGAKNISVSIRWLIYSNFFEDVQKLPNWDKKLQNWKKYTIDKDLAAKGYYSEKTCIWLDNYQQSISRNPPEFWQGVDQIKILLDRAKSNPNDRRLIVTAWNPNQLSGTPLPPCHLYHQYQVLDGKLNSLFMMRSIDTIYGLPYNVMSYAFLNILFSKYLNLSPGTLTFFGGDTHIYMNQIDISREQVDYNDRPGFTLPTLEINKDISTWDDIINLQYEDVQLVGYEAHPDFKDKPPMAV